MGTATVRFILHTLFWFLTYKITPVSSFFIQQYGKLLPLNPNVWVGDVLKLTCVLTDTGDIDPNVTEVWRRLYFTSNGGKLIQNVYITRNSSRAINLRLPNIQIKNESTYYCRLNESADSLRLVGSQRIHVYHRPKEVKAINCVVHNWTRMRCTWDLGVKYHHPEHVNVSLYWVIESKGSIYSQSDCPHFTNTSCDWKEHDGKNSFKPDMIYMMAVVVENTAMGFKVGHTKAFPIDTRKIVKPAKVHGLVAQIRNSTCLSVEWSDRKIDRKIDRKKTCEIKLYSRWDVVEESWDTTNQTSQRVGLCGLRPSVKYRIAVRCRPRDYDVFFSDIAEIHTTMPEDVPSGAPVLTVGSFKESPCAKQNCRVVTIYWKPVPEQERNGVITGYQLSVDGTVIDVRNVIANQATVTLYTDRSYSVSVKARTKKGLSRNFSTLLIESGKKKPSPPEDFYVKGDGKNRRNVRIFWAKPAFAVKLVSSYTIYYCQAWKGNQTCRGNNASDGDLQWVRVPASETNHSLTLATVSEDYLFGISADTQRYSSGLIWSQCIYLHNRVPTKPPKNFKFDEVKGDLSLTVRWEGYMCEESGPVLSYNLIICQQEKLAQGKTCSAPANTTKIPKSRTTYTLTGLKNEKRYFVSLQAVTEAGLGPPSPWINATAVKVGVELSTWHLVGIAIGAIIFLCFALLGLIVCARRMKKALLDPPDESIIIPPPLPDPDRFDSYMDMPDYHSVGPSPAVSPTSRTSLLSNGNSTVASTGSDSTGLTDDSCQRPRNGFLPGGSAKSVDKLGRGSDKKKKKSKKNLPPQGYIQFASKEGSKSSSSLGNGSTMVLPSDLLRPPVSSSDKEAVVMFTMGKANLGHLDPPLLHGRVRGQNKLLQVPPSQYQQNVMQHASANGTSHNHKTGASVSGQEGGCNQTLPYIKVSDIPNNCVGSAVSLASSGGVLRHTPPLELCSSTDRDLSDYGGYEEPITGPLSASTPIATLPHPQSLEMNAEDRDVSLDQSYIQRPKLTLDSRSLPSILECGASHRRNSLDDSEVDSSTLSIGTDSVSGGSCGEKISQADHTCTPALLTPGSKGYVPHPNGAPAITVNGYVPIPQSPSPVNNLTVVDGYLRRPDMISDDMSGGGGGEDSLTSEVNGTAKSDLSKTSCLSVVRPISNYMKDLPAEYFVDPQAFDDLPTTEL